jgi:hypothetical protein
VALIAFLMLRMAQHTQTAITSPVAFARLVKANLMQVSALSQLHRPLEMAAKLIGQAGMIWNDPVFDHV